ncbi:MAG: tRNA pseudouridine(55) synthase TruB [Acutalibacteraceae bacterium]
MNGILCLDKPQEMTSFAACAAVRRALGIKKAGHAGTLDPMATGVLPILCGNATRALDFLPSHDKRYTVTVRFGLKSDTQDIWGQVCETGAPLPNAADIETALSSFRGEILQTPPMMSALKKDGVRLYELARKGLEVERAPRKITISALNLLSFEHDTLLLDCVCSKGAYMRTLAADLGDALGCGAVMAALRRTEAAGFSLDACLSLEKIRLCAEEGTIEGYILPTDRALGAYPAVTVTAPQAVRFQNGGGLFLNRLSSVVCGLTRIYAPDGRFLGLGEPRGDELTIARLFAAGG